MLIGPSSICQSTNRRFSIGRCEVNRNTQLLILTYGNVAFQLVDLTLSNATFTGLALPGTRRCWTGHSRIPTRCLTGEIKEMNTRLLEHFGIESLCEDRRSIWKKRRFETCRSHERQQPTLNEDMHTGLVCSIIDHF